MIGQCDYCLRDNREIEPWHERDAHFACIECAPEAHEPEMKTQYDQLEATLAKLQAMLDGDASECGKAGE